jgi:hypothetical protein
MLGDSGRPVALVRSFWNVFDLLGGGGRGLKGGVRFRAGVDGGDHHG